MIHPMKQPLGVYNQIGYPLTTTNCLKFYASAATRRFAFRYGNPPPIVSGEQNRSVTHWDGPMNRKGCIMPQHDIRKAAEKVSKATGEAAEAVREQAQGVRDKLEDAVDRGAEALGAARQGAADMAANMRDEAERLYRKGERRVSHLAGQASDEAGVYYDELSEMVRRQPATALGIAAGIGFLVGILIARR